LITVVPLPRAAMTMMRISTTSAMLPIAIQIGLVVLILIIVMAARGSGTTVIKE